MGLLAACTCATARFDARSHGAPVDYDCAMELPDKWMVRRIQQSTNEQAWWIAANPAKGIGKVFPKDQWDEANQWAIEQGAQE